MWRALKKWIRTRNEGDKEELREEKRRLKDIRRKKREEEKDQKRERLEKSRNMNEFWEAIKEFRTKRKRKGEGIEKEKWLEHFMGLLGGEEGNEGEGGGVRGRKEVVEKRKRGTKS